MAASPDLNTFEDLWLILHGEGKQSNSLKSVLEAAAKQLDRQQIKKLAASMNGRRSEKKNGYIWDGFISPAMLSML